jgi:hypothetical protein
MSPMIDDLGGPMNGSFSGKSNRYFLSQFSKGQESRDVKTYLASKHIIGTVLLEYGR